jgi:hypothetical protein
MYPTQFPTKSPTYFPTAQPTILPTDHPTTLTVLPSAQPTQIPSSKRPSTGNAITNQPTLEDETPTFDAPSFSPSAEETPEPTSMPVRTNIVLPTIPTSVAAMTNTNIFHSWGSYLAVLIVTVLYMS